MPEDQIDYRIYNCIFIQYKKVLGLIGQWRSVVIVKFIGFIKS